MLCEDFNIKLLGLQWLIITHIENIKHKLYICIWVPQALYRGVGFLHYYSHRHTDLDLMNTVP